VQKVYFLHLDVVTGYSLFQCDDLCQNHGAFNIHIS